MAKIVEQFANIALVLLTMLRFFRYNGFIMQKENKSAMDVVIPPENGLQYCLDLRQGSTLHAPLPDKALHNLPVGSVSYGYFVAGPAHFTDRSPGCSLYQVFLTRKGQGRFLVGANEYVAGPDTVLLLDLNQPHRYEALGDVWEHEWVNFSGGCCAVYHDMINADGLRILPLNGNETIPELLHAIGEWTTRHDALSHVHTATEVIRLLDALCALAVEQQRMRLADQQQNILRSVRYMEEHYQEPLTLETLAQTAYLSRYYYLSTFNQYMGATPHAYLTALRISHARRLLLTTSRSIEDISWRTGFRGSKNLIRQFKQSTGMTPSAYRRARGDCPPETPPAEK